MTYQRHWLLSWGGKLASGDVALTLGAGDIYKVGEELVEALK